MREHQEMVTVLAKPGIAILQEMTPGMMNLIHMAMGISGEAGELLDAVKKPAMYNKEIDRENIVEELGDLEFYMEGLRQQLQITREETLRANMAKLAVRYHKFQYSDQAAQTRADKQR
jgi:NTP pyrophosphatase (non-canonical NTP hydrolase)